MANYWAITIGINQYELFQPLGWAQNDAEALNDLLVTELGFLEENCLLMTNSSPARGERSSHPNRENILYFLQELEAKFWQPGDYLWFFLSGYGVNYNNKDYLLPQDANPDRIGETAIPVGEIMQGFQTAGLNVLLIFDINRAFGTQADAPVGQEMLDLARELNMAIMLSCSPEQFSHESSELGHGFFTAALLEALSSAQCRSLKDLDSYLSYLAPQLCQHHWRPIQNPVIAIPERLNSMFPASELEEACKHDSNEQLIFPQESFAQILPLAQEIQSQKSPDLNSFLPENQIAENKNQSTVTSLQSHGGGNRGGSRFIPILPFAKDYAQPSTLQSAPLWQQFIWWGGGTFVGVIVMGTIILQNHASFRLHKLSTPHNTSSKSEFSQNLTSPLLDTAKSLIRPDQASSYGDAIKMAKKIPPGQPEFDLAQAAINDWSDQILQLAKNHADQGELSQAIETAGLVPPQTSAFEDAQDAIQKWRRQKDRGG